MAFSDVELAVYRCESCGNYQLGTAAVRCCGDAMTEVDDTVPIDSPDEEELVQTVFDISETELEVCRCLMAEPEITVEELAEMVDRDRSVVTRHLNHLTNLGLVENSRASSPTAGASTSTHTGR